MEIQLETALNACHWTAFVFVIALPFLLPACPAAAAAAGILCSVTYGLRVGLRIWRKPSVCRAAGQAWRPFFDELIRACLLL